MRGVPFDAASVPRLPLAPGVYMFRSARGEILYIGKAKSLRPRVRSYLSRAKDATLKTRELARRAASVETLVVGSEAEALILEANLVKEHQPRFNIQLRDDKKYPYIKVTASEAFPRIHVTRRVRKDGSRYFGPFTSVGRVRRALEVLKRNHGIRSCRYNLPAEAPARPCLDHHIGRCAAPCVGLQSRESYAAQVDAVVRVLSGDVAAVQAEAEAEMHKASDAMDFERAAHWRDVLAGLDGIARQQRVQAVGGGDRDVLGLARDGPLNVASTLRVRGGVLIGRDTHTITGADDASDAQLVARSLAHAYLSGGSHQLRQLPQEILLPTDFADRELFQAALAARGGRSVRLHVPKRGAKARLVDLAVANARHVLDDRVRQGRRGGSGHRRGPLRASGLPGAQGRAPADRLLRRLPHPGRRRRGQRRDLPQRSAAQGRLSPHAHSRRLGQRRLPVHGRGRDPLLPARGERRRSAGGSGGCGWRKRAAVRRTAGPRRA